ncbi:MAG: phosphonopyruvate decarboxylase, partial [Clostridia bacterium]|nr:phosphonopyruvate decarboxylase [Clostridia bacterium]
SSDFYTGVPDSQLKQFCDCLYDKYGIDANHHVIAANEGNCVAIAAGYHLATGKVPVVYLQNSGEGNIINPVASLLNDKVYAIPCIFIVGWRGEPGVHDEPQHIYQGEVTVKLLEDMGVKTYVLDKNVTESQFADWTNEWNTLLLSGKQVAVVVKKGALEYAKSVKYANSNSMLREEIIKHIVSVSGNDPIISTTGKASRELFEIREANKQGHGYDFLTVGSMGHCSSIALGVAVNKPETKIWCIDGDGAALMHMGAMAVIGSINPKNLIHIVINNGAHETVGGMPTVAGNLDIVGVAKACGYLYTVSVDNFDMLDDQLKYAKRHDGLTLIEVNASLGARADLGRPTTTALDNKKNFMEYLKLL